MLHIKRHCLLLVCIHASLILIFPKFVQVILTYISIMQEYRLSVGTKIFTTILFSFLLTVAVGLAASPLFTNELNKAYIVLGPISYLMTGFFVYALLQMDETTIIDDYSVRVQSRFNNRELLLQNIQGYRIDKNYLYSSLFLDKAKR